MDCDLKFNTHIEKICRKAGMQLNAVWRLSKYLDIQSKTILYNTFIMYSFSYINTLWHFCSHSNTVKMKKINKTALHIVFNEYTSLTIWTSTGLDWTSNALCNEATGHLYRDV